MTSKKEMEFKHDLEMEKLRYVRETELKILEKQFELAHRQPPQYQQQQQQYYPTEPEEEETMEEKSKKKFGRKKK